MGDQALAVGDFIGPVLLCAKNKSVVARSIEQPDCKVKVLLSWVVAWWILDEDQSIEGTRGLILS